MAGTCYTTKIYITFLSFNFVGSEESAKHVDEIAVSGTGFAPDTSRTEGQTLNSLVSLKLVILLLHALKRQSFSGIIKMSIKQPSLINQYCSILLCNLIIR
jgi:hypothetical protein